MRKRLASWLAANQDDSGDWSFSEATRAGFMQPWFAGWTFPSMNPACTIVGLAKPLGLTTPEMEARVRSIWEAQASVEKASTGAFYNVLPYVEYLASVDVPDKDTYIEALATNIERTAQAGGYDDAGHFFEHVMNGPRDMQERIDPALVSQFVDKILDEQREDGGWPTPYDEAWRPWVTADALRTLDRLRSKSC